MSVIALGAWDKMVNKIPKHACPHRSYNLVEGWEVKKADKKETSTYRVSANVIHSVEKKKKKKLNKRIRGQGHGDSAI